ncbi:hypothetical protein Tco_1373014 [Tanacetum coccineum]
MTWTVKKFPKKDFEVLKRSRRIILPLKSLHLVTVDRGGGECGGGCEDKKVDAPPVNDDNANANEGNAEDDVVAHVLDDDDDVVVSDDDEVNPSTNVEEVLSSDDSDDDNRS